MNLLSLHLVVNWPVFTILLARISYDMSTRVRIRKRTWPVTATVVIETEALLNVIGSHVHCKSGNTLEIVQDSNVITAHHTLQSDMGYALPNRAISDDLECLSRLCTLQAFKIQFLYSCTAVDKIFQLTQRVAQSSAVAELVVYKTKASSFYEAIHATQQCV